jgi:nuclear pore complex protein Nup155
MFASTQQTPQRPLPGGFINTPAPNLRHQSSYTNPPPPTFRLPSQQAVSQRQAAPSQSQSVQQQPQQNGMAAPIAPAPRDLSPVELAKIAINEKLEAEGRFPPLEEYIGRTFVAYTSLSRLRLTMDRGDI